MCQKARNHIYIYILIVLCSITTISGLLLASSSVSANDSATDTINLTIPESCTLSTSSGSGQTYNAQISNGQYKNDIGKTRLSVFCNTQDSFAVYAVGYSNDTVGSTDMVNTTSGATNILTGTATSGSDSNWAMKIEAVAGNGTDIYTPVVLNPYDDFTSVPSSYAKVAEVTSATTRTVEGAIDATYQVYISPRQQAGAYTGKVRYTVVHPASVDPSAGQANLDTGQNINKKLKSLASGADVTSYETADNLITSFIRSDTLPANFTPSDANTISLSNSLTPVYVWFDSNDGAMYYYSKAKDIYMNSDSRYSFNNMKSLADISGLRYWLAENIDNASLLFENTQLSDLTPIANWRLDKIRVATRMFYNTKISDLTPIANWITSSNMKSIPPYQDSSMGFMIAYTLVSDLTPIANWDVSNVMTMPGLFEGTQISDLTPIANWNVGNVTIMNSLLEGTKITTLNPISGWDTSKVTSFNSIFANIPTLVDSSAIASWDVRSVLDGPIKRCGNLSHLGDRNFVNCFENMFYGTTPKTNLPIFTSRPGTWDSNGTYIPNP